MKVYIVTSEYSCCTTYVEAVFKNKKDAEEYASKLKAGVVKEYKVLGD